MNKHDSPLRKLGVASSLCAVLLAGPVLAQLPGVGAQACYVTDSNAGTDLDGLLFSINETNGVRAVVSDFHDASQGALGMEPGALVALDENTLLVLDLAAGNQFFPALMSIDVTTGERQLVSDFGDSQQGPLGRYAAGITIADDGSVLVVDLFSGSSNQGSLFDIDLATGQRTAVSDFGDFSQGPVGSAPIAVIEASGQLLVLDQDAGANRGGMLFAVDRGTGERTVVTDFNDASQGPTATDPVDMVELPSGDIYVVDGSQARVLRVSADGSRSIVSDFNDAASGPVGRSPVGMAVDGNGNLVVIDSTAGTSNSGALFVVSPVSGDRELASDFGDANQGELGLTPFDIVLIGAVATEVDSDGDSVPDEFDECPEADAAATVVGNRCNSGVENFVLENGCTVKQALDSAYDDAAAAFPNRPRRAARKGRHAVKRALRALQAESLITRREKRRIKRCL